MSEKSPINQNSRKPLPKDNHEQVDQKSSRREFVSKVAKKASYVGPFVATLAITQAAFGAYSS